MKISKMNKDWDKEPRYVSCNFKQEEGIIIHDLEDGLYMELPPSEKGYKIMTNKTMKMHWVIDDRDCPVEW